MKAKTIQNPWITKSITKSSKKKQRLYERFLKKSTPQNEQKYKTIKTFSKQLKRNQGKYTTPTSYLNVLEILKKTWNVMKDINENSKIKSSNLPRKFAINKKDVYNKPKIVDAFNDSFTNIV